jgi:transposase
MDKSFEQTSFFSGNSPLSDFAAKASPPLIKCSNHKSKRSINVMSRFKAFHDRQKEMLNLSAGSLLEFIDKKIPGDHLCRLAKEVVFSLDTSAIESRYSHLGQNTYHPKLLLSVLFYGYATGTRSSRQLEDKCRGDYHYIYLMQSYSPDHSTISDFRKNNKKEIEKYFVEVARILSNLGIKEAGKLSLHIDGTKIKGSASAKRSKTREGFKGWLSKIEDQIKGIVEEAEAIDKVEDDKYKLDEDEEKLKKKLSNRKYLKSRIEEALKIMEKEDIEKMNLTDQDAFNMKCGGSKDIRPGYNCQAAVTEKGFILAAESLREPNDKEALEPMIEQSESNTEQEVEEVVADSGYGSYANYEYLENKRIDGYVPDNYFQKFKTGEYDKEENRYHHTNFTFDSSTNSYICPEGKTLKIWKTRMNKTKSREWNHNVYKGTDCSNCSKRSLCTKSKARELLIEIREPLLKKMRKKLLSEKGKLKYLKRHYTIEPIFGHFKYNLGYRHFLLRGIEKVNAEFKLMCIGWNLTKMLKMGVRPAMI